MGSINQIKRLASLFVVGAVIAVNGHGQTFLTNGLVAYYQFNGNANDSSGHGWHGTPLASSGAPITPSYSTGNLGGSNLAINLSGGSFVDLGLSITPNVPTGLSQSFWVKSQQQLVPSIVSGNTKRIVFLSRRTSLVTSGNTYVGGWPTMCINFKGNLAIDVDDDNYGNENQITNIPANLVFDGKWHQVVGIKNGTAYSLYLDGNFVGQFTDTHPLSDSDGTRHIWLGRHWWNYMGPEEMSDCNATLGGVRIYNRALSASEVAQLYAIESPVTLGLAYAVRPTFSNLAIGTNYQLQVSTSLAGTFTNFGSPFTATTNYMIYPQYFDVANWGQLFFRVKTSP